MTCRTFCGDARCRERCLDLSVTDQRSGPTADHYWPTAHRADAYCPACGGTCREPWLAPPVVGKPLSLRPDFTGSGSPTFKPARHGKRAPGK